MPDVEWNRRTWSSDLREFATRNLDRRRKHRLPFYGAQWGDPVGGFRGWLQRLLGNRPPRDLAPIVARYVRPFVTPSTVVLEIGAGGGRWTRHLLRGREVIAVDLNPEFFSYLHDRFRRQASKLRFYQTTGYELSGISAASVDFVFTFGTFVHIDPEGIECYLAEIERVLRPEGIAVIQYADQTKALARENPGFSDMNPARMEGFLARRAFALLEHETTLLPHSSIVVLRRRAG